MTALLRTRTAACAAFALVLAAAPVRAQVPGFELNQVQATRPALEDLLARLEQAADSRVYSAELRSRARAQAQLVRNRLTLGDFQPGDLIMLRVEQETTLTDTFTVQVGPTLNLPNIGVIPLTGTLRSELTDTLARRLAVFLRNPVVRTRSLVRVTVEGAVARQGFYTLPVDILVSDVFTLAGGLLQSADMRRLSVERGGERIFNSDEVATVITQGRTLDALGIQAGDRFVVPAQKQPRNPLFLAQTLNVLISLPFTIYTIVKLF